MPKKRSGKRKTADYEVEDIIDHQINIDSLRAEFRVKWVGYSKDECTWEPIDHVYHLPVVLNDFIEKNKTALHRRLKDRVPTEMTENMSPFKPLDESIIKKFTDPEETIPTGDEELLNIQKEFTSTEGNFLWVVVFNHDKLPCFVRKSIISYYWPFHASMFINSLVELAAKTARLEAKIK